VTRPTGPVFTIKLRSIRGDGIHGLRAILKRLLRSHGFKCIAAFEEFLHSRSCRRTVPANDPRIRKG
jgi:hypothetical protein